MGLNSALHVGRTGLMASQTAMEVVGNNLTNAATPGYSRQRAEIVPATSHEVQPGTFIGLGVKLQSITRAVDEGLVGRLRTAVSDQQASLAREDLLKQIESLQAELTDHGMSSRLDAFFGAWSDLANNPTDYGLRTLVVQHGESLANQCQQVRQHLIALRDQVDQSLKTNVQAANGLLDQVASLNRQITAAEGGGGNAHSLRDERDLVLQELAEYLDLSTIEQPSGSVDVFIGSTPIVLTTGNRGIELKYTSEGDQLGVKLRVIDDGTSLSPSTGRIGAMMQARTEDIGGAMSSLGDFATQLIHQVNLAHSQGQGTTGLTDITAGYMVEDATAALNNSATGLDFQPEHGSFLVHVTQQSTGHRETQRIDVDLDGLGGADTTLNDLATAIDAVDYISATVGADGRLQITSDSQDFQISFSQDTSGVLAALGINTFFTGRDASDIAVDANIQGNANLIAAAGRDANDNRVDNATALSIASLYDQPVDALGGISIGELWSRQVESLAVKSGAVSQEVDATGVIFQSLTAQREAISGVNVDEEAINLMAYQRSYQGAARFISVVDELMATVMTLVR
jgi:flagellar hook-associated protein 1 FlgK